MDLSKLKEPFPADRISWRVGSTSADKTKGMALAYIDARDVMERLDEVCGLLWQCEYVPMPNGTCCCRIGIKVGDEWVWRSNGALNLTDSDKSDQKEMAEKGSYSDSFKRAAVLWGIGQYLYNIDSPWVEVDTYERGGKTFVKGIKAHEYSRLESVLNRSKPTSSPRQPQPATAASEPERPTITPQAWGRNAIDRISSFKTRKEMDDFENKFHLKIASLRPIDADLHANVVKAIRDKHAELAA